MTNESNKSMPVQVTLGLAIIGMGILFLLDRLDILNLRGVIRFWPTVFIVVGLVKLADAKTPTGYLLGAALVAAGVMMTLRHLGLPYLNFRALWPLVLIGVGCAVVYKALAGRKRFSAGMLDKVGEEGDESVVNATAILGGFERRITSQTFRGGEATAIMGGCVLDLRDASIEGEAVLNVVAVLGGITLKTPTDWTIILHGTPILGGFEEKTAKPPNNSKRLVITGTAIMGGVEVRN
jgi:predicted membrane protein